MLKRLAIIFFIFSFSYAQETKAEKDPEPVVNQSNQAEKTKKKTMEEVLKNTIKNPGLFNMYQDTTSGKAYMLVKKDQLNKEFIHFVHGLNGQLNAGVFKGSYRGARSNVKVQNSNVRRSNMVRPKKSPNNNSFSRSYNLSRSNSSFNSGGVNRSSSGRSSSSGGRGNTH